MSISTFISNPLLAGGASGGVSGNVLAGDWSHNWPDGLAATLVGKMRRVLTSCLGSHDAANDAVLDVRHPKEACAAQHQANAGFAGGLGKQIGFTFAVMALAARIARVRGLVSHAAFLAFRDAFPPSDKDYAKLFRIFSTLAEANTPYHEYTRQICGFYPDHPQLYRQILVRLTSVAAAEGDISPHARALLIIVARGLGVGEREVLQLVERYASGINRDPYAVLGVARNVPEAALKRAYHRLVREFHPDGLEAYNVPREVVHLATQKLKDINAAYHAIQRDRGLKRAA